MTTKLLDGLKDLPNPYDFANPVPASSPQAFIGRETQLKDVGYYLDEAIKTKQPISIALVGERAAGKTSLLNWIQHGAGERGLCVARIDLNEGDAESALKFFFKVFNSVLGAAVRSHSPDDDSTFSFEGMHGRTYQTYLEMISTFEIPQDRTWCPFLFPIVYANAMSRNKPDALVPEDLLKEDLARIQQESGRQLALLFDECNVLADKRPILEMFRNVFMNMPGFFLVLTGTPGLFPVIDEVFSPIVRQFQRIRVDPFESEEETDRCIRGGLERIGIKEAKSLVGEQTAGELHELTAGRPYEIQLLCHSMFKRLQLGQAQRMELSVPVLDDVLRQLRSAQAERERRVIQAVRSLENESLRALQVFCGYSPAASPEDILTVEYVCSGNRRFESDELLRQLDHLVDMGVTTVTSTGIEFTGDYFDRVYTKYYAKHRNELVSFPEIPIDIALQLRLGHTLTRSGSRVRVPPFVVHRGTERDWPQPGDFLEFLMAAPQESVGPSSSRTAPPAPIARGVYEILFDLYARGTRETSASEVVVEFPFARFVIPLLEAPDAADGARDKFEAAVAQIESRSRERNGKVAIQTATVEINESLLQALADRSPDLSTPGGRFRFHTLNAANHYLSSSGEDKHLVIRAHIEQAVLAGSDGNHELLNNLGYMLMAFNDHSNARVYLNRSFELNQGLLAAYNLAILDAKEKRIPEAIERLEPVREKLDTPEAPHELSCLLIPTWKGDHVEVVEVHNPIFSEAVNQSLAALRTAESASRRDATASLE